MSRHTGYIRDLRSESPSIPEPETIYQAVCRVSAALSDTHHYLAGRVPDMPPEPKNSVVDCILTRLAYTEGLAVGIQQSLGELI